MYKFKPLAPHTIIYSIVQFDEHIEDIEERIEYEDVTNNVRIISHQKKIDTCYVCSFYYVVDEHTRMDKHAIFK
jgi:hypothetical protein